MRRRPFLAACSAAATGLAGCLSGEGFPDPSDPTDHRSPDHEAPTTTEPPETRAGTGSDGPFAIGEAASVTGVGEVTVEAVAIQRSVIHHHLWRELYEPEDAQMLVVEAGHDGEVELAFTAELEGEAVDSAHRVRLTPDGSRYALSVPVRSADRALVRLEAGERPAWVLPESARSRLSAAPEFHLHGAATDETDGETVLELRVENTGERHGTFRGIVVSAVAADADAPVRFPVPAGETVTEVVDDAVVNDWPPDEAFEHPVEPDTRRFAVEYA